MYGSAGLRCVKMGKSSLNYRVYIANQQHPISLCNYTTTSGFLPRCMECRRGRPIAMRKLSVCLSNAWIVARRKKYLSRFFIPYERSFSLVFWEEEWLVGATPSTWNFGSTDPHWSEIGDFQPIFACSASTVTPSEKSSINANIGSPPRTFHWT